MSATKTLVIFFYLCMSKNTNAKIQSNKKGDWEKYKNKILNNSDHDYRNKTNKIESEKKT